MKLFDNKLTQQQMDRLQAPLELDLIALFKIMQEDVMNQFSDKNLTPEQLIHNISLILADESAGTVITKSDRPVLNTEYKGFVIGIENPKGTYRVGVNNGRSWKTYMYYDYGFIYDAKAPDGDSLDVYLGPGMSDKVFLVRQIVPETGGFDEYKAMMGFASRADAFEAYISQYNDRRYFGGMDEYSIESFRELIYD